MVVWVVALLVLFAFSPANAVVFYMDQNNVGLVGGPWATVTLTDITSDGLDGVHFDVDPDDLAFTNTGTNFGFQTFYFNEATLFGNQLEIANLNTDWDFKYSPSSNLGGTGLFGKFEFRLSGDGGSRLNPLTFDVLAPVGKNLTIWDLSSVKSTEGYIFAGHIEGFESGTVTSGMFATVPIPNAAWLLGAGVVALIGLKRRRSKA